MNWKRMKIVYLQYIWWPICDTISDWKMRRIRNKLYRALLNKGITHENAIRVMRNEVEKVYREFKD